MNFRSSHAGERVSVSQNWSSCNICILELFPSIVFDEWKGLVRKTEDITQEPANNDSPQEMSSGKEVKKVSLAC